MVNEKHILKTRVNCINGHYGLPVFANLATEAFFHQVQSLMFQMVADPVQFWQISVTIYVILANHNGVRIQLEENLN